MAAVQGIMPEDLSAAKELLNTIQEQARVITAHVQSLTENVRKGFYPTEKGLSFLELKDQLLLLYMQDLVHIIMEKASGKSLKENPGIMRLVEIRTVLEKMRPIDQKLKYQIDKLVRAAVTGSLAENDPLRFKPNPQNLISKLEESDKEGSDSDQKESGIGKTSHSETRKYVPPRLAPVHYDNTKEEREKRILERAKKRALSSSVIRELKDQYTDAPEEIREGRAYYMMQHGKEELLRTNYEETMMVRLNLTRKEKALKKRSLAMTSQLNSITHFSDISVLTRGDASAQDLFTSGKKYKKRPKKASKKGKKKTGFRRRR